MRADWGSLGWLDVGPGGVEWSVWLGNARLAANLVIVAASLSIARVLFTGRRAGSATAAIATAAGPRAPRLLVGFAGLAAVCGLAHLVVILSAVDSPPHVVPTLTKMMAAVFWVISAVHAPRLAARLRPPALRVPRAVALETAALAALTQRAERLKSSARTLETMIRSESAPPKESEAMRQLRETLAELEAESCKT